MAFNDDLAQHLRDDLDARDVDYTAKKMFGGLAFMINGHMTVGITGDDLMARVGKDAWAAAVAHPHAREMDFTGKSLKGFVYVSAAGWEETATRGHFVDRALEHTLLLPPK